MRQQPVTRPQVSGYRFGVRRLENAVVRRDVRGLSDPLRSHSRALAVGIVLAAVAFAGSALFGLIRPQSTLDGEPIVVVKDTGAMFVNVDDTMHPVLNLASARLIAGSAANPVIVSQKALTTLPRGQLIGIPGAPSAMPYEPEATGRPWSVCDEAKDGRLQRTVVVAGAPTDLGTVRSLGADQALLVRSGERTFLVYDGRRARIDMSDGAVTHALALEGRQPRQVSAAFLGVLRESAEIAAPDIPGAGGTGPDGLREYRVGTVVRTDEGDASKFYVVLESGVQPIGTLTGELIRATNSQGRATIPVVAPDVLNAVGFVDDLDVTSYPAAAPTIVDQAFECATWEPVARDSAGRTATRIVLGPPLDVPWVELVQADGSGPNADAVYLPAGTGVFAQAVESQSIRRGDSLNYVSDTGVRYGVANAKAASMLGLRNPEPVPWQFLSLLATGPGLSREDAYVIHDGMDPDAAGEKIEKPER